MITIFNIIQAFICEAGDAWGNLTPEFGRLLAMHTEFYINSISPGDDDDGFVRTKHDVRLGIENTTIIFNKGI